MSCVIVIILFLKMIKIKPKTKTNMLKLKPNQIKMIILDSGEIKIGENNYPIREINYNKIFTFILKLKCIQTRDKYFLLD